MTVLDIHRSAMTEQKRCHFSGSVAGASAPRVNMTPIGWPGAAPLHSEAGR